MKRDDTDLSGAFNDGYEPPSFWMIVWGRLKKKIKNRIELIDARYNGKECARSR
jgi:hypothetical protein